MTTMTESHHAPASADGFDIHVPPIFAALSPQALIVGCRFTGLPVLAHALERALESGDEARIDELAEKARRGYCLIRAARLIEEGCMT